MNIVISILSNLLQKVDSKLVRKWIIKLLERLKAKVNEKEDAYDAVVILIINFLEEQFKVEE